jgi:hypothetical protein
VRALRFCGRCWAGRRAARLVFALCASAAALAAAPIAASACPSLRSVNSFRGHADLGFSATASGQDPGNGGTETVGLSRSVSSVQIRLTAKKVIGGGVVVFTGKASGGAVSVSDTFNNTGTMQSGAEDYGGPVTNQLPNFGSAELFLNTRSCKYQFEVGLGAETTFSGDAAVQPGATVTGFAYGERRHIPNSLNLSGATTPDVYDNNCPGSPFVTGRACYAFGGGWTTDFDTLKRCHSVVAANCGPSGEPLGTATFSWSLQPQSGKGHKHHRSTST